MEKGIFKYYTKRGRKLFFRDSTGNKLSITLTEDVSKDKLGFYKKNVFLIS